MAAVLPTNLDDSVKDRFWSKVAFGDENECWEWRTRSKDRKYGQFVLGGKSYRAHRLAYALANGIDPGDLFVCHRCDNPRCCNPKHLFAGTPLDNVLDMVSKGRNVRPKRDESKVRYRVGSGQKLAKLNEAAVLEIRRRHSEGEMLTVMAAEYNVHTTLIWLVVHRKAWKHV